jgi:4a-hydroxytetrahydrobiopterin dehydratase
MPHVPSATVSTWTSRSPHDEAAGRIRATLAAGGGTLRYDAEAPAFWVLADPEGNEACITTWQGRDP